MTYASPSTINATTGIFPILQYVNEVTDFWISRMLMVAIFIIFLIGYLNSSKTDDDFVGAIAVGSYASLVIGTLFWLMKFLDSLSFGIIIGLTIISSAVLFLDRRGG